MEHVDKGSAEAHMNHPQSKDAHAWKRILSP